MRILMLLLVAALAGCANQPPGQTAANPDASSSPLKIADVALQNGAPLVALRAMEGVLAADPRNSAALLRQAQAQQVLGNFAAAETSYQRALAVDSRLDEARLGLAKIWLRTNPVQAEKALLEVLDRDPHNTAALNNLGVARDLQGKHTDAQEAYRRALELQPGLASARGESRAVAGALGQAAGRRADARSGRPGGWPRGPQGPRQLGRRPDVERPFARGGAGVAGGALEAGRVEGARRLPGAATAAPCRSTTAGRRSAVARGGTAAAAVPAAPVAGPRAWAARASRAALQGRRARPLHSGRHRLAHQRGRAATGGGRRVLPPVTAHKRDAQPSRPPRVVPISSRIAGSSIVGGGAAGSPSAMRRRLARRIFPDRVFGKRATT